MMTNKKDELLHAALCDWKCSVPLLVLAAFWVCACGLLGLVGRDGATFVNSSGDMHFLIVAGECWRRGVSPYELDTFVRIARSIPDLDQERLSEGFAYPPQVSPLCLLLTCLPLTGARILFAVVNLASMVALIAASIALSRRRTQSDEDKSLRFFVPIVVALMPFTANVLFIGQTSLIAAALLFTGWLASTKSNRRTLTAWHLTAGILLGMATFKPQVALLPLAWLALRRKWKLLTIAAVTAIALCAWPFSVIGRVDTITGWVHAADHYAHARLSVVGFKHVFGVQSTLVSMGVGSPSLAPVAAVATALLWWRRREFRERDIAGILVAISFLFIYAHDYDLVALTPLIATLWTRARSRTAASLILLAALGVLFMPQRIVPEQAHLLLHCREIVCALLLGWLIVENIRTERWLRQRHQDATIEDG